MAMVRFPNSTIMGRGLGAFAEAINACTTSPIPAAKLFSELARPAIECIAECAGELALDGIRTLCDCVDICYVERKSNPCTLLSPAFSTWFYLAVHQSYSMRAYHWHVWKVDIESQRV